MADQKDQTEIPEPRYASLARNRKWIGDSALGESVVEGPDRLTRPGRVDAVGTERQ